jgi:hypothetical protein
LPTAREKKSQGGFVVDIELKPSRIFYMHGVVIALLIAAHWTFVLLAASGHKQLLGLPRLFFMGNEANVPAFFSALAIMAAAVLAALIARTERIDGKWAARWLVVGALLVFMSFDEAASIHELLDRVEARRADAGIFYYAWVIPYFALVVIVAASLFAFWLRLPARTRTGLAVSAAVYCAGAIGMELVQGAFAAQAGRAAYRTLRMSVYITFEEGAEMLGVALLIRTLLAHLASQQIAQLTLRFGLAAKA